MFEFIRKLQKKPEDQRRRIAFASAVGFTVLIVALWVPTLSFGDQDTASQAAVREAQPPSPFTVLRNDFSKLFGEIGGQVNELRENLGMTGGDGETPPPAVLTQDPVEAPASRERVWAWQEQGATTTEAGADEDDRTGGGQ